MLKDIQSLMVNINTGVIYQPVHRMTTSFGPRVLVDFVNRWYILEQPAGRTIVKGILKVNYSAPPWKIIHIQIQKHTFTR